MALMSSQETHDSDALEESGPISRDDDVALAPALAQAARAVKHVVDLGAGRYGVAATYGPGQRITRDCVAPNCATGGKRGGCAPRRGAYCRCHGGHTAPRRSPLQRSGNRTRISCARSALGYAGTPVLLRIADETRRALAATLRRLRPNERWDIDIIIDDLRDTDADGSSAFHQRRALICADPWSCRLAYGEDAVWNESGA